MVESINRLKTKYTNTNIENGYKEYLVTLSDSHSVVAEQYRKLRTIILHNNIAKPMRSIMITSALPVEGKSITAVNLAISISKVGSNNVLLIDADLRRPSLHKFFSINNDCGLTEYLQQPFAQLNNLIINLPVPRLSIIPSGNIPSNPSELLSSKKLDMLIDEIYNRYPDRYIIIDSTPVISSSEPSIIASKIDAIILVVNYRKTPREIVRKAIESLKSERILGIVFNNVDITMDRYNNYSYYY